MLRALNVNPLCLLSGLHEANGLWLKDDVTMIAILPRRISPRLLISILISGLLLETWLISQDRPQLGEAEVAAEEPAPGANAARLTGASVAAYLAAATASPTRPNAKAPVNGPSVGTKA